MTWGGSEKQPWLGGVTPLIGAVFSLNTRVTIEMACDASCIANIAQERGVFVMRQKQSEFELGCMFTSKCTAHTVDYDTC